MSGATRLLEPRPVAPQEHAIAAPTPFVSRLSHEDRHRFLGAAALQGYRAGDVVFRQDDHPDVLLVVQYGCLRESHCTTDGQELIVNIYGPGDVAGLAHIFVDEPSPTTLRAATRTDALLVRGPEIRALLSDAPSVALAAAQVLTTGWRDAERARIRNASTLVLPRISSRVLELAERWGRQCEVGVEITLHLSQAELASWAGVSREAAVKALRILREEDVVHTGRRRMTVVDLARLRTYAAS